MKIFLDISCRSDHIDLKKFFNNNIQALKTFLLSGKLLTYFLIVKVTQEFGVTCHYRILSEYSTYCILMQKPTLLAIRTDQTKQTLYFATFFMDYQEIRSHSQVRSELHPRNYHGH